jgi:ABC-type branched-subunit amino acid transport system ATPase component
MNVAILLVEENAAEVLELADLVGFMDLGRLEWFGPKADISENELAVAYVGGDISPRSQAGTEAATNANLRR